MSKWETKLFVTGAAASQIAATYERKNVCMCTGTRSSSDSAVALDVTADM